MVMVAAIAGAVLVAGGTGFAAYKISDNRGADKNVIISNAVLTACILGSGSFALIWYLARYIH